MSGQQRSPTRRARRRDRIVPPERDPVLAQPLLPDAMLPTVRRSSSDSYGGGNATDHQDQEKIRAARDIDRTFPSGSYLCSPFSPPDGTLRAQRLLLLDQPSPCMVVKRPVPFTSAHAPPLASANSTHRDRRERPPERVNEQRHRPRLCGNHAFGHVDEYDRLPPSSRGFVNHDHRVLGHLVAGLEEREHRVRWIGLEAVVAFAPQVRPSRRSSCDRRPAAAGLRSKESRPATPRNVMVLRRRATIPCAVCTNIDSSASSCSIISVSLMV